MLQKVSTLLENKIVEINKNEDKRDRLITKIVAYNNGDVKMYLDNGGNNKRVQLNRWYHQSYPIFIRNAKRFVECKDITLQKESLTNLITNTMSWIAGIPKSSIHDQGLVARIHEISTRLSDQTYTSCDIKKSSNANTEERDLYCKNGTLVNINEYVKLINILINSKNAFNNFPTVTKLMHFINPNIFPIFDTNVKNVLFGENQGQPTGSQFLCYLQALHDLNKNDTYSPLLISLTNSVNTSLNSEGYYCDLSTLRVIDLMLFDESMD